MAAWPVDVLAGDLAGPAAIRFGALWLGPNADKFRGIEFSSLRRLYEPHQLRRMRLLDAETTKTFLRTAAAGLIGGALFGTAGLLAGALVGGKKVTIRYGLEFDDGNRIIIAGKPNNKVFRCLLLFAKRASVLETEKVEF